MSPAPLSNFTPGAGFRIAGFVVRKFVPPSGKCAFLTLDIPGERGSKKLELRTFDEALIVDVGSLVDGAKVEVTGNIDSECLKDKARNEVKIDGRQKWVPALTIKAMKVEASSCAPAANDKDGW